MAYPKAVRTEHGGAKNMSAKGGWWGRRADAKYVCNKARRLVGRQIERDAKGGISE